MTALNRTAVQIARSSNSLRSSSIATSSRVQLQHFLAAPSPATPSLLNASNTRANVVTELAGKRYLHGSQPLDPVPNQSSPPPINAAGSITQSAGSQTSASGIDQLSLADHHVHVPLSYLHPATKTLPLDKVPSARQLALLPSFEESVVGTKKPARSYVPLSSHVFATPPRRDVLHAAVVYYLDSLRSGTASTKTRSQIAGSGRKIRPQKGTGQARLGRRNNPLLRGGGTMHGPKPRSFASDLPRQVRELALRSALSARWMAGDLFVVPSLHWDAPPIVTGQLRKYLYSKQWDDALFLTAPRDPAASPYEARRTATRPSAVDPVYSTRQLKQHELAIKNFALASGNIPRVNLIELNTLTAEAHALAKKKDHEARKKPGELHAYEVLHRKKLVLDLGAVEWLEQKLGGSVFHLDEWSADGALDGALDMDEVSQELTDEQLEENDSEAQDIVEDALGQEKPAEKTSQ